jgi:hypothetical protein
MTEFGHPAIFVPDVGLGSYDALKGALRWTLERKIGHNRAQGCAQMDP